MAKEFPDLTGDGKVTKKDILMGRGVVKKKDGGSVKKKLLDALKKRTPSKRLNVDDLKRLLKQKRRKPKKDINRYDEYMRSKKSPPKTMKARGGGIAKRGMGRAK